MLMHVTGDQLLRFSTVEVLIAFYENRLKDHYVVTPPVLQGLKALVSLSLIRFSDLLRVALFFSVLGNFVKFQM